MQNKNLENLYKYLGGLAIVLTAVAIVYGINLYKEGKLIGGSASNTITVTGTGSVMAKPDISSISFTLREQAKDNKSGQDKIAAKMSQALPKLKELLEDKDIRTDNYASYPRYNYNNNTTAPKIEGYDVSQTVTLKVRNIDNVSKVLDIISTAGINEVSGPSYSVDDNDKYKEEARSIAITEAKEKAKVLAGQLGVDVSRIVSFSESDNNYYPYARAEMATMSVKSDAAAPSLPAGENEVVSNVSITFEIK